MSLSIKRLRSRHWLITDQRITAREARLMKKHTKRIRREAIKRIDKKTTEIIRMMFSTWGSEQKGVNIESDTAESDY